LREIRSVASSSEHDDKALRSRARTLREPERDRRQLRADCTQWVFALIVGFDYCIQRVVEIAAETKNALEGHGKRMRHGC
jgi:hypothetical protein